MLTCPETVPMAPWLAPAWWREKMRFHALRWKVYRQVSRELAAEALQCAQFAHDRWQEKLAEVRREKHLIAQAQRPRWGVSPTRPRG